MFTGLVCIVCGRSSPPGDHQTCRVCGPDGILDARYDYDAAKPILTLDALAGRSGDMWRYLELLPVPEGIRRPDVQVGWTTIHEAPRLAAAVGVRRLFLKDEGRNPTSYFKDRVFKTIVPRNVRLSEAPSHGVPISQYDALCVGARPRRSCGEP